jgi:pantothenate kinase type III
MMRDFLVTIDKGNTNTSYAFHSDKQIELISGDLQSFLKDKEIPNKEIDFFSASVSGEVDFNSLEASQFFKDSMYLDMPVHYSQSVGIDRLIVAYYAFKKLSTPCVIIDAGSFITVDEISNAGFMGGFILPGLQKTLNTYNQGQQLSSYNACELRNITLPRDTKDAIVGGVDALYREFFKRYKGKTVI